VFAASEFRDGAIAIRSKTWLMWGKGGRTMATFYVATRAVYVLVDAANEDEARELGRPALAALFRETLGRHVPFEVHTVRPASGDKIELMRWHNQMLAGELN
jgi:hypothetical protein